LEWRDTTAIVGSNAFATRVSGDSMVSATGSISIPDGAYVIVDPDASPEQGSIVIAILENSNQATCKKLVFDGPNKYLMPLNSAYKAIEISDLCSISGVVKRIEVDL
jgi:SOS-response transcriptional repressor LexA